MGAPRTCPWCAAAPGNLFIATKLVAQDIGTFSLSGMQPKVSAQERPVLVCRACRRECTGTMAPPQHCEFDPSGETTMLTQEQLTAREATLLREA